MSMKTVTNLGKYNAGDLAKIDVYYWTWSKTLNKKVASIGK